MLTRAYLIIIIIVSATHCFQIYGIILIGTSFWTIGLKTKLFTCFDYKISIRYRILDLFFGTGNPSYKSLILNKMFKNIGGKTFADVTASAKEGSLQKGHGVAFGDMDNDCHQDIYIEVGGD